MLDAYLALDAERAGWRLARDRFSGAPALVAALPPAAAAPDEEARRARRLLRAARHPAVLRLRDLGVTREDGAPAFGLEPASSYLAVAAPSPRPARGPVLVGVRDLDRGPDEVRAACARLLARAAGLPAGARLGVATTAAVAPNDAAWPGPLAELAVREPPREVRLEPLAPAAAARLAASALGRRRLPAALARTLAEWTGGLPGLVRRALDHLRAVGVVVPAGSRLRLRPRLLEGLLALPGRSPAAERFARLERLGAA